jgi:hypothetical protein
MSNRKKKKKSARKMDISEKLVKRLEGLSLQLERSNISEYVHFVKKPWRVISVSFGVGVARGFGMAIGMTIIFALVVVILTQVLSKLISLPVIGEQVAKIVEYVNQYMKEGTKINIK